MAEIAKPYKAKLVGNRRWTEDASGALVSVTRRYLIVRATLPSGTADEEITSDKVAGLPERQSAHSPAHKGLICDGYSFEEGEGNEKQKIYCDVHYSTRESEASEANKPPRGQAVEAYGWRSGSVARDLVKDAKTGKTVVNTAGQPFDSVPQIDVPSPTFSKVIKTAARQGWIAHFGKVNAAEITVGGVTCPAHTLRCVQVDEERLWNDDFGYLYRYTIGLQLMTNKAEIAGANNATEIGWDLAVVSAGTVEIDAKTNAPTPIKVVSAETGKEVFVSTPVLLDKDGHAMTQQGAKPYAIRVQAYDDTTFPTDFYSEPV